MAPNEKIGQMSGRTCWAWSWIDCCQPSCNDNATSEIIYHVLQMWFDGWTIIVIAHKLQWVLAFARVAVLDTGRLAEYDEPKRLLKRSSGLKGCITCLYQGRRVRTARRGRLDKRFRIGAVDISGGSLT